MGKKILIITGLIACVVACIGDFAVTFIFGRYYPGYSQLHDTMSSLGASDSPVSDKVSLWWVILGILIILFAIAFRLVIGPRKYSWLAAIMLVIYGVGEGFGSGLFKADPATGALISASFIHNALGGTGVAALMFFPLVMQKIIPRSENVQLFRYSTAVFIIGLIFIALFLFRFSNFEILKIYKGLWQRLFVLNLYIYLLVVDGILIGKFFRKHTGSRF